MNKTVYIKGRYLFQYDAKKRKETYTQIPFGTAVKVVNVLWGMDNDKPIWIVIQTKNSDQAYYKSGEASSLSMAEFGPSPDIDSHSADDLQIFDTDPRTLPGWGDEIVNSIANHEVMIGMNSEQVLCALGAPQTTNTERDATGTFDQWVYGNRYVYLKSGKVIDIQN